VIPPEALIGTAIALVWMGVALIAKTRRKQDQRGPMLWQTHGSPLGWVTEVKEDEHGLKWTVKQTPVQAEPWRRDGFFDPSRRRRSVDVSSWAVMAAAVQLGPDSDGYLHLVTDPDDDGTACGLNGDEIGFVRYVSTGPVPPGVVIDWSGQAPPDLPPIEQELVVWQVMAHQDICPNCEGYVVEKQAEAGYIVQHGHHPADPERRPIGG